MTTANKLTLLRIALVPVFLIVLYWDIPGANWWALAIFILASVTDTLDGYVARHYHQITDFGKFMDPLADKILVLSAMCWLVEAGKMAGWILAVVLLREFAVSGLRMLAVEQGRVIAAAWSGKIKTAATMVCLCIMIAFVDRSHLGWMDLTWLNVLCQIVILATTIYSGVEYFMKNRDVFHSA